MLWGPEETVQEKVGAQPGHVRPSAVSGTMCLLTPPPLGLFSATTKLTLHRNLWLLREREGGSRSCTQEPTPGPGWGVAGVPLMRQRDVQ